jgi:hypothetical protein
MPDALEYVVRPYTAPSPHGGTVIPSTPRGSRQKATLTWGVPTTMPEVSGMNFNVVCCKDTLTEQNRESDTVRVYQNNDKNSPNWTDWERPNTLNLDKKESNTCGDNWDDISGVAQQVNADLAQWDSLMQQVTGAPTNCGQSWHFKNQSSSQGG